MAAATLPKELASDVATLWDFNQMHHELCPTDLGVGLGSHDLGVATYAAELFHRGLFPRLVFTGANAPTTVDRFPRGEAVHYREHALTLGVPEASIMVEPRATHTGENIDFTRELVRAAGVVVRSITIVCRPYQQRRAYAMCRLRWPEVDVLCASQPLPLADYVESIGNADRVVNMLVGDTQRVWVYADMGWSIAQDVPETVRAAYHRLVEAGFTKRVLPT